MVTRDGTAGRHVIEAFLTGHEAQWLAEDVEFRDMTQPEPMRGRDVVSGFLHHFYDEAFSATRADVRGLVADGDVVAAEFVFRGRHTGSLLGELPTGREVAFPMIAVYEVAGGEIARARLYYNATDLGSQIGLGSAGEQR